jgi:hypothetical protein
MVLPEPLRSTPRLDITGNTKGWEKGAEPYAPSVGGNDSVIVTTNTTAKRNAIAPLTTNMTNQ